MKLKLRLVAAFFVLFTSVANAQFEYFQDEDHLSGQQLFPTNDDGFIIASSESCYTPGTIFIEGCPRGMNLVKLDAEKNLEWQVNVLMGGFFRLHGIYDNPAGGYTVITTASRNFACGSILIGGAFGWSKVFVYNISAAGEITNEVSFPDECSLGVNGVERLTDSTFIVSATYSRPFSDELLNEEQVFILNHNGDVLNQVTDYFERSYYTETTLDADNNFVYLYRSPDSLMRKKVYNDQLELVNEVVGDNVGNTILYTGGSKTVASHWLEDGSFTYLVSLRGQDSLNTSVMHFNELLQLESERSYSMAPTSDFFEDDGELVIGATKQYDDLDIQLTYFSLTGDSLTETRIENIGNETPLQLYRGFTDSTFFVVGQYRSTDPVTPGPIQAFIYYPESGTVSDLSDETLPNQYLIRVGPNPANEYIDLYHTETVVLADSKVYLYASDGKLVQTTNWSSHSSLRLDLSNLTKGIYFVSVISAEGQRLGTNRIIKE